MIDSKQAATELIRSHGLENIHRIAKSGNELHRAMALTILEIAGEEGPI